MSEYSDQGSLRETGGPHEDALYAPKNTKKILSRYGLNLSKKFGQNFLVDGNVLRKIVKAASVQKGESILEVGAGIGTLTQELIKAGAATTSIEIDSGIFKALADIVGGKGALVHGDAMKVDLAAVEPPPAKIVSNLPYKIAIPFLMRSLREMPSIGTWIVLVQKEVAERLQAKPGSKNYSSVSVKFQLEAEGRTLFKVPRAAFFPMPKIESAVMEIKRKPRRGSSEHLWDFVERCFKERRKQLVNALADSYERSKVASSLHGLGISDKTRAEELEPPMIERLYVLLERGE